MPQDQGEPSTTTVARISIPDDGVEALFGSYDANLKTFERLFGVQIRTDGTALLAEGPRASLLALEGLVGQLAELVTHGYQLSQDDVRRAAELVRQDEGVRLSDFFVRATVKASSKRHIAPKSVNQRRYLEAIDSHDIVFGIGPAGTGKTYLALAHS